MFYASHRFQPQRNPKSLLLGFFVLSMLAVSLSCVSAVRLPDVPRLDASKNAMEKMLSDSKLSDAVVTWSRALNQQELPNEYLSSYGKNLLSLVQNKIDTIDPQSKDFQTLRERLSLIESRSAIAVRLSGLDETNNLNALDTGPAEATRLKTLQGLLWAYKEKGMEQLALVSAAHSGLADKFDPELKASLWQLSVDVKNAWAQRALSSIKPAGGAVPTKVATQPAELLKAVATVWVDRGIRMQNGVGLPDRVIGTAFFIERNGYLLTNYHVITSEVDPKYEGYSRLYIRLGSKPQEKIPAKVVGWDPIIDLALLKVEIDAPAIIPLSDSMGEDPGTRVLVYGSPGGLENTVTAGIVSAVGRRFMPIGDIMQIDAAVNPGNSGGPFLNENGEFLGVIFAGIEQFEGVNFGVPAYWVSAVLPELFKGGQVRHSWMGLQVIEYRDQLRVSHVFAGSSAYELGLREGDVIDEIDGEKASTILDVHRLLSRLDVGKVVLLHWTHPGGKVLEDVSPTAKRFEGLLALQDRPRLPLEPQVELGYSPLSLLPLFGMSVEDIGPGQFGIQLRIKEVLPGSAADESSFSPGDTVEILNWQYDKKNEVAFIQLSVQRRKQGFLAQTLQLGNYVDLNDLI